MKKSNIPFQNVSLSEGFWLDRFRLNSEVSIHAVYERFLETGRFDALFFHHDEKEKLHIFYDSDVAKWIEAVAYLLEKEPNGYRKEQELIDAIAESIAKNCPDGYINSYFLQKEPENIFTDRDRHELYCMGHLTEAAIAYHHATGKGLLLECCERACDYIENAFVKQRTAKFYTPGHEEIELALCKLYRYTGKKKYMELCMFFLNERGRRMEDAPDNRWRDGLGRYNQSHAPVRQQTEAEGHAVRAVYLYTAMAEAAYETGDEELKQAAFLLFDDIVTKKMYITGGIGSGIRGECFTSAYDLPNLRGYSESCAAIGLVLFCLALQKLSPNAVYADTIERVMYNAMLSSTSLDGKSFFYENPLELDLPEITKERCVAEDKRTKLPRPQRSEVFSCSCCPPNINRIFARIGDVVFSEDEEAGELYLQQWLACRLDSPRHALRVDTRYPEDGKLTVSVERTTASHLLVRKPSWCEHLTASLPYTERDGYLVFRLQNGTVLRLELEMLPYFAEVNPAVRADHGKVALLRGPVVYCLEGVDNRENLNSLAVDIDAPVECVPAKGQRLCHLTAQGSAEEDFPTLYRKAQARSTPVSLRFVPYYTFANRGRTNMTVFVRKK